MDAIVYKATYCFNDTYAEGYIILHNEYVEGIFAYDYMAIYDGGDKNTIIDLMALNVESIGNNSFTTSYIPHQFVMKVNELCPGNYYNLYTDINLDYLKLYISTETVEGKLAYYLVKELLPKLRMITSN